MTFFGRWHLMATILLSSCPAPTEVDVELAVVDLAAGCFNLETRTLPVDVWGEYASEEGCSTSDTSILAIWGDECIYFKGACIVDDPTLTLCPIDYGDDQAWCCSLYPPICRN